MKILENKEYLKDIVSVSELSLPWEKLQNKSVIISGGSGMVGSCLADVLMTLNNSRNLNCDVVVIGRNSQRAKSRFEPYWDSPNFRFLSHDINLPMGEDEVAKADFVVHLASNTHPVAYATDPIGTITANIIGTKNLLDMAAEKKSERFVFASSNEIYGENRGDTELFSEDYCGYIDCCTLRAGYPESKRCGEALCLAYSRQKEMDVVIPRLTRTYGPTMLMSDTKAVSQFIKKGMAGEDIVLKSKGNQFYSYTYVTDAVSGLLTVMLKGECGEAYNIADISSDITLRDMAELIAGYSGTKVVFDIPDETESAGYSKATKARLDSTKLKGLDWKVKYDIRSGLERTLDILKTLD
ncbi:MAG: NAD-dependent epimerase/dehydratase family protein [Clostridia bacterium]|nr:NAD-dependent epimerase/dehydratase family protein [Clostridia bacterium]